MDGRGRRILLQATMISASTRPAFCDYGHVPELASHPHDAVPRLPVHHKSATHAGAERDHAEIAGALPSPQPAFAQRRTIGIILKDHGRAQLRFQVFTRGITTPPR